jgi:hypothetical protein
MLSNFTPAALFSDWDPSIVAANPDWVTPGTMDESQEHLLLSVHSWLIPDAQYLFSRAEHAYFSDPQNLTERNRTSFQVQKDSVDPIIEAGLADQIEIDGSEPDQNQFRRPLGPRFFPISSHYSTLV